MAKKARIAFLIVALICTGGWHWFEPAARKVAKGVSAFSNGDYKAALDAFVAAKGDAPDSELLRYNTAASLLRMNKPKEALEELSQIESDRFKTDAPLHFNKGNAHFHLQDYQNALEEYKKSLLIDPNDLDAKRNFELTLKKIKEEQQKNQQSDSRDQNQSDQEDKQQKKEERNKDTMQYLNQKEKEQQKKQRAQQAVMLGLEKDW